MTRPLTEIEKQVSLQQARNESVARLNAGGLPADAADLEVERLAAINAELATIAEQAAPPPPSPVLTNPGAISPADAAKRAAEIRADPRYWDPRKTDAKGQRLTDADHQRLVQEHSELLARASEET